MRNLTYGFSHGTHRTTTHGQFTPSLRDAPSGVVLKKWTRAKGQNGYT